jgi:hypothetical protein
MDTNAEKPKRGRGQPSKGDDSRCVSVTVKVTRNEYVAWRAEAKAQGMSFTGFLLEPRRLERERKREKGKP